MDGFNTTTMRSYKFVVLWNPSGIERNYFVIKRETIWLCKRSHRRSQTDDAKNRQYELLVNTDGRKRWLCLEMNLLVLFFSGFIAFGIVLLFLSIQMDKGVGFIQRRTSNEI